MARDDEQLESILRGESARPGDLSEADARRLADARAVRERLTRAMSSLRAPESLRERLAAASLSAGASAPAASRRVFFRRYVPLAAAAAVLLAAGAAIYFTQPTAAQADMRELVAIHETNLAGPAALQPGTAALPDELRRQLGADVMLPAGDAGNRELLGWRAANVAGKQGLSYVVRDQTGRKVSVIVSPTAPKEMGFKCDCGHSDCRCTHETRCDGCGIAARRAGQLTYCAVADNPAAARDVLASLTPR